MKCSYCERVCDIADGMNGYCKMYQSIQGTITENYPDAYLNVYPVSSESIPMLHFYPNNVFLLISTIGCNFACEGCISEFQTTRSGNLHEVLTPYTPDEILDIAREHECRGITFCLNEPTVSLPTFLRVARKAKDNGFLVGCSSNGYMTKETLNLLIPCLDFVNIGLKGYSDGRYQECGVASGDPVYRNIRALYKAGVFVEVSVMYISGREEEVIGASEWIQEISPTIPFQVMRFVGTHENLTHLEPSKGQGEELCEKLRQNLDHVYLFNTPATSDLDSRCPNCGNTIIHRVFFGPMAARALFCLPDGICSCGYQFPCKGEITPVPQGGTRILGGYRSIMGVKVIASFLEILGITDSQEVDRVCNLVISNGYLTYLQDQKDSVETFTEMIRYIGSLTRREIQAERVLRYALSIVSDVGKKTAGLDKPRVLAVLCHPLIPLYAPKFGNTLVEMAGGFSLNREQDFQESVNAEYTVEAFNTLDPDIILVAGNFAPSSEDFFRICHELNITCSAISHRKVRIMDSRYISGPLGWTISLMDVANLLHPELFQYSLEEEKKHLDSVIAENSVF